MTHAGAPLELWVGIECTCNRVGDNFIDQLESGGHDHRDSDLDLLADLGVRTVRYPLLWERTAPDGVNEARWEWADRRLAGLRARGIEPIVGLLHHGSGPRYTSLLDPEFADKFAAYAAAVARRYPWITRYTPINEPLTTARFSALYGHWFPHARDDRSFARAIVNELRGIQLAMRAIRDVNSNAVLIQTEDLGKTYSTPRLEYQAQFENERRWLTFDALCGAWDHESTMWRFLRWAGIAERELEQLRAESSKPDVLGINHYVTSERFLDERLDRYPQAAHGGNQSDVYADVEAARVLADGCGGPRMVMAEAWKRYGLPIALTEVHIGATREDQLRWLHEAWCAAREARETGADVRAVTAWSLFGAFDWHALVTRSDGHYEPGAFDVRGPSPRPTAVAAMIRALARTGHYEHAVLHTPGWWKRADRLQYRTVDERTEQELSPELSRGASRGRPLLITGATGTLGRAFARACDERGIPYRLTSRTEMDIADPASVESMLDATEPWAIINTAGYVRVDDAEHERDICFRENRDGAANLARSCARHGVSLLTFSSDLVFDGELDRPYVERDEPRPLGAYGSSKAEAECAVLSELPDALVIRSSAFFGLHDEHHYIAHVMRALGAALPLAAPHDEIVSPTFVPDLVSASLDLLIDGERGIWHLANQGATSWADLARVAAERAGLDASLVIPCAGAALGRPARRPRYSVLGSGRGRLMPPLEDAINRYFAARETCMQPA